MISLKDPIEFMRDSLNSDVGIIVQYAYTIASIVTTTSFIIRKVKINHYFKGVFLITLVFLLGFVFPLLTLLFSYWSDWQHIVLNLLAAYAFFSFAGLLWIIRSLNKLLKE